MLKKNPDINAPHGKEHIIKIDILGMIHSGENPFDIIYRFAQYLEEESSEAGYAKNILENMRTVYGLVLKDKKLLTDELHDVEDRCRRIEKALESEEFSDEEKARITLAINLHHKNAERLKTKIKISEAENRPVYLEKY